MSFHLVRFGPGRAGLATVGYQLRHPDDSVALARTTTGVDARTEPGAYGVNLTYPTGFTRGEIVWDTGEVSPVYASEEINDIGTAVWSNTPRTLTESASAQAQSTSTSIITRRRGDKWVISLTGLGSLAGRTKLWFTAKIRSGDPADSAAIIQIIEGATGLAVLNGGAPTAAGNGSLVVDDQTAGNVTITLSEVETAKVAAPVSLAYDIQMLSASGTSTKAEGSLKVSKDVTRATS